MAAPAFFPLCKTVLSGIESADVEKTNSIELFSRPGKRVKNYLELVHALKAGDSVIFSDQHEYKILKVLGEGNRGRIFDIGNDQALRISKYEFDLKDYAAGFNQLKDSKINLSRILSDSDAASYEYVLSEKIDKKFSLRDFIYERENLIVSGALKNSEVPELFNQLKEFAVTTEKFSKIMDLRGDQIVWDGSRWVLLDWGEVILTANFFRSQFAFAEMRIFLRFPLAEQNTILNAMKAVRLERRSHR